MSTLLDSISKFGGADSATRARAAGASCELAPESLESITPRRICLMRFVLSLSALAVTYLDPSEPARFVTLTYAALLSYTAYSGLLYALAAGAWWRPPPAVLNWVDLCCYCVFIALSSGTSSIFFFFFFFSILVASFRGGYISGLNVTFVSAALYTGVGYVATVFGHVAGGSQSFELNQFLLRPISLLLLGYMIAAWGGSELTLKRRLSLLKSISRSANPRFGVDQTVGDLMEAVREFYDADTCLLVTQNQETLDYFLRRADRYKPDRASRAERVTGEIGWRLASLLGEEPVGVVRDARPGGGRRTRLLVAEGVRAKTGGPSWLHSLASLERLIGEDSFLSVPWRQVDGSAGRLYVTSPATRPLGRGDLEFLCQVTEHAGPLIENMKLVDRLASMAAEQERRRISLDLHDSTVQPYLGLKMGLEALCRRAAPDNPVAGDLTELLEKTKISLADLRRYVSGLRQEEGGRAEPALPVAVREYAEQFTRLYGLQINCEAETGLAVSDRLAAEAFQIVREGLNNVERHTTARQAVVRLLVRGGRLVVEVENLGRPPSGGFTPRSIRERAEALGGTARVAEVGGSTVMRAEIPV